jgi:hypothetical protein
MTDDKPTNAEALANAVGITLGVLALVATAAILLWAWQIGDLWPSGGGNAIPPCLPDIDHHCLP